MELDAASEAQELRSLVAVFERERNALEEQLAASDEELAAERARGRALEAHVQHLESREMLLQSPTVSLRDDEAELLRQKVDESAVVIKDLEARLATAEEGEAHLLGVLEDKEAAHRVKLAALAGKLATAEMEQTRRLQADPAPKPAAATGRLRLCEDQSEASPHRRAERREEARDRAPGVSLADAAAFEAELRSWKQKWKEAEGRRIEAEAEALHLHTALAEVNLAKEGVDSPDAAPHLPPHPALSAAAPHMNDPEVSPGGLREMTEKQLLALVDQYASRMKHLAALQGDAARALHAVDPKHPDPDAAAAAAGAQGFPREDGDAAAAADGEILDAGWLELAHWMRCRFGRNTSLKELKKHVEGFAPKKLRVPGLDAAAVTPSGAFSKPLDSPTSHASSSGPPRDDANEALRRAFLVGRREGRAMYAADAQQERQDPYHPYHRRYEPASGSPPRAADRYPPAGPYADRDRYAGRSYADRDRDRGRGHPAPQGRRDQDWDRGSEHRSSSSRTPSSPSMRGGAPHHHHDSWASYDTRYGAR
eukprot:TRINITY_DN878_c0_g1_i5.p1 TRINITY_DN878_c0_g1~~TRINITY_DN878_c0_g1_i5.p1  ORF type:complete len:539 (+),score=200.60 TRINITY_DN878_c0_g1_i5:128-1744(+)